MSRLSPWRVGLEEKVLRDSEVVKLERHRMQKGGRILEDLRPGCLNPKWERDILSMNQVRKATRRLVSRSARLDELNTTHISDPAAIRHLQESRRSSC